MALYAVREAGPDSPCEPAAWQGEWGSRGEDKVPMGDLADGLRRLGRQNIGFALFLAWNYIALYGCAMAIGSFVPYNLEYIWLVSAAGTLVCAAVLLGLMRAHPEPLQPSRRWGVAAMACAIAGNISLWLCYAVKETFWVMFVFAGLFDGVAIVLFTAIWGVRLTRCNEARIEFDVVTCFVVSLALYAVTLPIKLYGLVDLAVECLLPPLSVWFAFREAKGDDPDAGWAERRVPETLVGVGHRLPELRLLGVSLLLIAAEWFVVAFFRVVDAPVEAYDRYTRYFIAFTAGFLVTLALFYLLIRAMRYVNIAMSYRWLLPFAMLNVAVLSIGGWSMTSRIVAYAVIHAGMFGMQMALWIALAKYLRRSGGRPAVAFVGMAAAQGLGILAGCGTGLLVAVNLDLGAQADALLIVAGLAVLVTMAAGFSPSCYFVRHRRPVAGHAVSPTAETAQGQPGCGAAGLSSAPQGASRQVGSAVSPETGSTGAAAAGEAALGAVAPGAPASLDAQTAAELQAVGTNLADVYDALMHQRALDLQHRFGLTDRETEVAELLLCGRSRPYIRDELDISLNTVHAHARSILAKCQVHSARELIDLPPDTTAPHLPR